MANPTSNFGWQMPTSTDLVTDLPADFEVFGQAVDTSLADLKGGTTGQVLSKATNADMDFTWVTTDDANAIQNSIVDAKGDLIAASANDTPARLAVGNNGETLVADSSTATGLRYQAPVNVNPVINSAMQVWQRGTSGTNNSFVSGNAGCNADRWQNYLGGGAITVSRQATGDTTNLPNVQYCARVQRNSGNTTVGAFYHSQTIETVNAIAYAGKTVTISYYARAGANFSAASSILSAGLLSGTGTDQNVLAGFTGNATVASANVTLTTTWQRFTFTGTVATNATELGLNFYYTTVGTAGAADYFEITGVQLEVGSVATPFKTYAGTIQGELAACQRYYYRTLIEAAPTRAGVGYNNTTTTANIALPFPVAMRTRPTALEQSGTATDYSIISAGTTVTACSSVPTFDTANTYQGTFIFTVASGLTAGQSVFGRLATTNGYLGWSAEL